MDLVKVEPVALLPTQAGCAVFLGDGTKSIVFYIEPAIGASINAALSGQKPPRPLTHDLMMDVLTAFGASVQRVVIVKVEEDVFLCAAADYQGGPWPILGLFDDAGSQWVGFYVLEQG